MSLPSFTAAAKPTARAARRAARNRAQTLVELIGADSGQYPTQREIDERVNAWADRVIPDADLTPPATVISNRASTSAPDPVALTTSNSPRSPTDESALGHIMEIIRGGGFPLDEEPIQAPLFDALASRLAPPPVAQSTSNLIQLEVDPNDLPVDPEILKLDPASSQYDPDNFDHTKIGVAQPPSPALSYAASAKSTKTTVPCEPVKIETPPPVIPAPLTALPELIRAGFIEATKTTDQRTRLLKEVNGKNEKLHTLLQAHFLFDELAGQARALHGQNNNIRDKLAQIQALLVEADKEQLDFHKKSTAHLRECERRAKEYQESLSPTVLVNTAPAFFRANAQQQQQRPPNVASPTPQTPSGQPKLSSGNPKWARQNPHLLNGKLYSSHVPREEYRHYKCDHCTLFGHLHYDCPAYKCPVCNTNCGKKPKNCPQIIPPLNTEVRVVDVPPPYAPRSRQDGRQTPFHGPIMTNPTPIANRVQGHTPLRNRSRGRGMPSRPYQRTTPRPLAPIITDNRGQGHHPDVPCINIDHRQQPFREDLPPPTLHREHIPVLAPFEIPTSRTPYQVVDHVTFPAADMSVTYQPRPSVVGFRSRDAYIDARIDAGDYGTLFEW